MKYLLDSDTAIDVMRRPRGAAAMRFRSSNPGDIAMSIVTKAELLVGPQTKRAHPDELQKVVAILQRVTILPFDDDCATAFGRIAAALIDAGTPVDGMDVEIAATAMVKSLIVVTGNKRDFGKIAGLQIENWMAETAP